MIPNQGGGVVKWWLGGEDPGEQAVELSIDDLLYAVKSGEASDLARSLASRKLLAGLAARRGIGVSADELAEAVARWLEARDLIDDEQVQGWLAQRRLTPEQLHARVREQMLAERVGLGLVPDDLVQHYFDANRRLYAKALVEIATFESDREAREARVAVREGGIPWHFTNAMAVRFMEAPEDVVDLLFSAQPEDLVGPVVTDDGRFELWRLERIDEAVLDEQLAKEIREMLLARELAIRLPEETMEFSC